MNFKIFQDKIVIDRVANELDDFVIRFCDILNKIRINYVIVSGYVSILFGRSRLSEDVDLLLEKINFDDFRKLWNSLSGGYECIQIKAPEIAYQDYLMENTAIRFCRKGQVIPNFEIKFPKDEIDLWTIEHRQLVLFNKNILYISPIELQIPFKLFLGSEKDIEDAKHLYSLLRKYLNIELLNKFINAFNMNEGFDRYLK